MPIYLVKSSQGDKVVDASTKAQAINHVVKGTVTAEVITASAVVKLMKEGHDVEQAGAAINDEPTEKE